MEHARVLATCPERGFTTDPLATTPTQASFWRRRAGVLAVVGCLLLICVWLVRDSKWTGYMIGSALPRIVEPGITRDQLQSIAEAKGPGSTEWARRVRAHALKNAWSALPGDWSMFVGWTAAQGKSAEWVSVGWPRGFVEISTQRVYVDAVAKAGWIPCRTDPTARPIGRYELPGELPRVPPRPLVSFYGGNLVISPKPESVGGVFREVTIHLPNLAVPFGLIALAAVLLPRLARRVLRRVPRDRRVGWMWLASAWFGALLMLGFIAFMSILTVKSGGMPWPTTRVDFAVKVPWPPGATRWEGFAQLPLSPARLDDLIASGDADRPLARMILDLPGTGDEKYLTIAAVREGVHDLTGTRARLFADRFFLFSVSENRYIRRPDMGVMEPMTFPAGIRRDGWSRFLWSSGDPTRPVLMLTLQYENILSVVLGLTWTYWIVTWLSRRAVDRRERLRRRDGQCVACGYSVLLGGEASLGAAVPPSPPPTYPSA